MSEDAKKLLATLLALFEAGRPHGTNHRGDACECESCENWDKAGNMHKDSFKELEDISGFESNYTKTK